MWQISEVKFLNLIYTYAREGTHSLVVDSEGEGGTPVVAPRIFPIYMIIFIYIQCPSRLLEHLFAVCRILCRTM